jgi:pimeloyl-ACP methyl ester carboxylesterase
MAQHVLTFLAALKIETCDVLGFSLGGMIAQRVAQDRPSVVRSWSKHYVIAASDVASGPACYVSRLHAAS